MAATRRGPRYAAELPRSVDLVVVGGGVVGCGTAFFAARAGLRIAVLERRPLLATLTTAVSSGAFRLQFDNAEEIALVREGIRLFESFGERAGLDDWSIGLQRQGYLFGALTAGEVERARRLVGRQHEWGVTDIELLSGEEARYRFPYLSPEVRGARYRAGDGWLDPRRLALGYATAASDGGRIAEATSGGGATFCVDTTVTGFLRDGERVVGVLTDRGPISAAQVVIAAGPFTGQLAALAGLSLEIRPTRRQKLVLPDVPEVPPDAPMTIEEETAAHWRPALGGAFCLWTEAGIPAAPPLDDVPVSGAWAFGLLAPHSDHSLARLSPFWADVWERGDAPWYLQAGQYEYTPDRRPYLGPTAVPGLSINGGYSGHGIMASAAGGRIVVDLLMGSLDSTANPFRPDRPMLAREFDIL